MANKVQLVEQLKQENKHLRLELQQIKTLGVSDAFRQIGFTPLEPVTDQGHGKQLAIQSEHKYGQKTDGGFFMTETEDFRGQNSSPL